jgi:hypothetical protein
MKHRWFRAALVSAVFVSGCGYLGVAAGQSAPVSRRVTISARTS